MNLMLFSAIFLVLIAAIIVVAVYRARLSRMEQESLHVLGTDPAEISQKMTIAQKLLVVERWMKILVIVTVIYGIGLLGLFLWDAWERTSRGAF
ncbi:MAG: hypothetical protein RMI94_15540 [Bryobacterales bacterium]|nr:hypothetical protein [Bryobacteraceae bacterium]MDW8131961.1 hypothetical protein [Bryobacterales bacterium]